MKRKFRVGVAGLLHESNTFLSTPTDYDSFATTDLTQGSALTARWRGARHELGGIVEGLAAENDIETVPLYATYAVPSGTITAAAFERVVSEMLEAARGAGALDGLLVALHGATVSEAYPDADGEILTRLRRLFPRPTPIVVTLDLHANVSRAMAEQSDAMIAYRTNPHLDQRERGLDAARLMARTLRGEVHPVQWLETPPLLIQSSRQVTSEEPASRLYQDAAAVMDRPGVLSASVAMGFYYSDVSEMGASFWAVADGDVEKARSAARWMAERAWALRSTLVGSLHNAERAVTMALSAKQHPVVLLDVGDNVGGGSPGDSTILLAEILRQQAPNALVVLYDPGAVAACAQAGVGARVELEVGGKTDERHGRPVVVAGAVRCLHDGRFEERQVRHGGWGLNNQGLSAVVETDDGHTIALTSRRMAPFSLQQVLSLGIAPERKDIIVVKGVVAPRAAYEPVAAAMLAVDTPGVTADSPQALAYARRRVPLFPLEQEAAYPAAPGD